jgi:hypothetical protein
MSGGSENSMKRCRLAGVSRQRSSAWGEEGKPKERTNEKCTRLQADDPGAW